MTESEQYEAAKQAIRSTIADFQEQNERLVRLVQFYADQRNWKNRMVHMDQGAKARDMIDEIEGRRETA